MGHVPGNRWTRHRFEGRRFGLSPRGRIAAINVFVAKAKPKRRLPREDAVA
ncbi:MAG TPA: hypothetical protein VLM38_07585 [Blastocatellia bacterium]|nr:hypothetical protein [Blastocatellia bacterium]